MSGTPALDAMRDRLRGFLAFLRAKLLAQDADTGRLSDLRRLSDVRLRRFCVGRPRVTALDVCALLADPRTGRFDPLAQAAGLLQAGHFDQSLPPLEEDMGFVLEACLVLQLVGPGEMAAHLKEFVAREGPLKGAALAATAAGAGGPAPFPPQIDRILGPIKGLWSPPPNVLRILDFTRAAQPAAETVAAEIEKDPPLAERFLRISNAASPDARSTSIRRSAIALGFPAIRRTVLAAALTLRLGRPRPEIDFDLPAFWTHALRTAHGAAAVARASRLGDAGEHFAAGLLHEAGALAFYQHHKEPFARILESVKGGAGADEAERKHLGVERGAVGACILERWQFSPAVAAAARHHRVAPAAIEDVQLPREAVAVAAMCRGGEGWGAALRLAEEALEAARREAARLAERSVMEVFA